MERRLIVDYLRGVAALSVAWFHLTWHFTGPVQQSGSYGWLGVEVFFVISGMVIPLSIANTFKSYSLSSFPSFLIKRLIRIEPPYLLSIILVILLPYVSAAVPGFRGEPLTVSLGQLLSHFLYLVPITEYDWLQQVYWTLAYEFAFYISIGLLFPLVGKEHQQKNFIIGVLLIASLSFYFGFAIVCLFLVGLSLYRSVSFDDDIRLTLVGIAFPLAVLWTQLGSPIAATGAMTAWLLLIGKNKSLPTFLATSLSKLGALSYSLYLVHIPIGGRVVNIGRRFVDGTFQELCVSVVALAVSIAAAYFVWRIVEQPAIAAARLFGNPGRLQRPLPNSTAVD